MRTPGELNRDRGAKLHARHRARMVRFQLSARGIRDPRVLAAMGSVPREEFVDDDLRARAYDDAALPIEHEQTISQPYIVALMSEALGLVANSRVLEIGTGSGYAAAVLAELTDQVFSIERVEMLAADARARLVRLGYERVRIMQGDGTRGWPEEAPFDAIVVAASGPRVPVSLREQLAVGGCLVIPIGSADGQRLVRVTRVSREKFTEDDLGRVRFVPLLGREGWSGSEPAPRD